MIYLNKTIQMLWKKYIRIKLVVIDTHDPE